MKPRNSSFLGRTLNRGLGAAATYLFILRPGHRHWGATARERARRLPGDELVKHPRLKTTRAVTIKARPDQVWPWLTQMGAGRAGFYTWPPLERQLGADPQHPDRVVPRTLSPGDEIPLTDRELSWLSGARGLTVREVNPERSLVLDADTPAGAASCAVVLEPRGAEHTRMIVRVRWEAALSPRNFWWYAVVDPGEPVAVLLWLQGLKRRAEHQAAALRVEPEVRPAQSFRTEPERSSGGWESEQIGQNGSGPRRRP